MATRLPASQRTREGLTSLILVSAPRDAVQVCCDRTNEWLKEIEEALGPDRHRAYQALRAVLHCLRDRLTLSEAAQLADQLPMLVRGIYYEAWHPAGKPEKIRSRDEFLSRISAQFSRTRPINAEHAARAVFQVLENYVSAGEIREVIEELPHEIRMLWPEPQAFSGLNAP